jgi:hypothetical protein
MSLKCIVVMENNGVTLMLVRLRVFRFWLQGRKELALDLYLVVVRVCGGCDVGGNNTKILNNGMSVFFTDVVVI